MLDIPLLQAFVTLAEYMSFSEAADKLYITQPALSHRIKDLEEAYGIRLFERNRRNIRLTKEGEILLPRARTILTNCEDFSLLANSFKEGNAGSLRLGFLGNTLAWTTNIISSFHQSYPNIDIKLSKGNFREVVNMTQSSQVDAAIVFDTEYERLIDNDISLEKQTLGTLCLQIITPKNFHPELPNLSKVPFTFIKDHPMVFLNRFHTPLIHQRMSQLAEKYGFEPNIVAEADSVEELYAYVETRGLLTVSPQNRNTVSNPNLKIFFLVDDEGIATMHTCAIWNKNNQNPALHFLSDFLKKTPNTFNPFLPLKNL